MHIGCTAPRPRVRVLCAAVHPITPMTGEAAKQHGAGPLHEWPGKVQENQHGVAEENAQGTVLRVAMRAYRAVSPAGGRCKHRGTRNPHSPVPGPPGPLPASPGPRARCACRRRLRSRAGPGPDGNQHTATPTPRHRPARPAGNTPQACTPTGSLRPTGPCEGQTGYCERFT
jgi:hypothetical protein